MLKNYNSNTETVTPIPKMPIDSNFNVFMVLRAEVSKGLKLSKASKYSISTHMSEKNGAINSKRQHWTHHQV